MSLNRKIQVLIVDDSAFMRLLIGDLLSHDSDVIVVGTASNGKEAVEKSIQLDPDVVLLDMNMAEYDGLYAVEQIMAKSPRPILILSAVGNTNLDPIFDALRLGAVDYINKPKQGNSKIREIHDELIEQVRKVSRASPMITSIFADQENKRSLKSSKSKYDIIAIGASTGGPSAVEKIIASLPANLNVPVIIGQHMPANFIKSFAARLNNLCPLKVVVGVKGLKILPGMVVVASGDGNTILKSENGFYKIDFDNKTHKEYNHPSINALFSSVAQCYGKRSIGVILTGMGKDGVKGLQQMKNKGASTMAQDEESSIIYGMPKYAHETGAAQKVFHINEIGSQIINLLEA